VLEIGCATGDLLAEARRRGARVTGVDVSAWAAEAARRRHGVEVLTGTLESLDNSLGRFHVILALEVIEHVENPREFLQLLSRHLLPGGYTLISTPNYRCARRFGGEWSGFQRSLEHLYFLSDEVLSRMAAATGLEEVIWYTAGNGSAASVSSTGQRGALRKVVKRLPGAARALSLMRQVSGEARYVAYGQGHNLVAAFRKIPPAATGGNELMECA
jgi:SAM-dependent methyltransferase